MMKQTTKESIENTVIGRDNVEREQFLKTSMHQKVLSVDIKDVSSDVVGEFILKVKKDKTEVKAYKPYHLEVTISGIGDFYAIKPIQYKIDGVKVFAGKIEKEIELSKDGYSGTWSQKFAFVSNRDFEIPEVKIEYFNSKEKRLKNLVVDVTKVKVTKGYSKKELLDDVEEKSIKFDYTYLYYLAIFIAGFLVAKIEVKKSDGIKDKDELFNKKIDEVKSLEELMVLLALKDSKRYEHIVLDIEAKKLTSLKNAKKMSKLIGS